MIGAMIKRLREQKNWKQVDLAEKLGITRQALSHYETNRRDVDTALIQKLSEVFEVSADFLLQIKQNNMSLEKIQLEFEKDLNLSDTEFIKENKLIVDGKVLTATEINMILTFIRFHRSQ